MASFKVELVKYDMDKTTKRKRANFTVESKTEQAIINKLERIHKGEKLQVIHEIIWGEEEASNEEVLETITGFIKFFNDEKGFGFIRPDEDMDDVFFHASSLGSMEINDNDIVEFVVSEGPKGLVASKIKVIDQ